MKITIAILLLIFTFNSYAQDLYTVTIENLSLEYIKKNAKELDRASISNARKIRAIIDVDVIDYYDLKDKYDSELKLKVFKDTEEYKNYKANLIQEKENLLSTFHYIHIKPLFKGHSYHKGEYNLEKQGFFIKTGWSMDYDFEHKIDKNYIYFKSFPGIKRKNTAYGNTSKWEEFFIPFNEEKAIMIENNPKNYSYMLIFKLTGLEKVKWDNEFSDGTITLPKADKVRILILENINVIYSKVH